MLSIFLSLMHNEVHNSRFSDDKDHSDDIDTPGGGGGGGTPRKIRWGCAARFNQSINQSINQSTLFKAR